jgi:hypothetical protein
MFTTQPSKRRLVVPNLFCVVGLSFLTCSAVGPAHAANPSGIPAYLIVKPNASSITGQPQELQMNSMKKASHKSNPLWLKHHNRLNERKAVAAALKRRTAQSKNYSRVSLNYRLNVDVTNPMGINPWGNHYRRSRYSRYRSSWLSLPRVPIPVTTISRH